MRFEIIPAHRQERSRPDVQGDKRMRQLGQDFRGEMQSGRGCRHRTGLPCVNRLVTHAVFRIIFAAEVGRNRHVPELFQIRRGLEPHNARAVLFVDRFDLRGRPGNGEMVAGPRAFARTREGAPTGRAQLIEKQQLDATVSGDQSRRNHPRVVEHEHVARTDKFRQVTERPVGHGARGSVHHHHSRGGAVRQRTHGHQLTRQFEIVVGERRTHASLRAFTGCSPAWRAATESKSATRRLSRRARTRRKRTNRP